jgi:hypothetical protein
MTVVIEKNGVVACLSSQLCAESLEIFDGRVQDGFVLDFEAQPFELVLQI